ncbi:polyprenyl diphosphate synthase [Candidatus Schneideria nysicola]|uniref:polyprenyl diphosphate synthase n=1 Tax=Candidatus Schneideria nysicola TaxID=1081631 RepID=UPI001CAA78D7|nr:polyprenyl diphosphate synthase [Candidatus Schneideria nysicola]UAJ66042.1 di-trans,poly-cis-decaprenylcistransferase [Candidatus Schneideria nysicola]
MKKSRILSKLPRHVAIIMDGNGRWAKNKGKLRILGHQAGVKSVHRAVNFAINHRLDALTLYAFSSENWNRPIQEVSALMTLFIRVLENEVEFLQNHNIRFRVIGDIHRFDNRLQECIRYSEDVTQNNDGLTLNIAANYGGRWDIIQAVRSIAIQVKQGILHPDQIDENTLRQFICMNELAPVDLVIRTGGEHRISNFLLWQIAYSELFFTDVLWPDFNDIIFRDALYAFARRKRNFGRTVNPSNYEENFC